MRVVPRVLGALSVLVLVACGGAAASSPSPDGGSSMPPSTQSSTTPSSGTQSTAHPPQAVAEPTAVDGPQPTDAAAESAPAVQATPSPQTSPSTFDPYRSDIPLTASLSPTCVVRGGTVTITVETIPEVVVGYETFYADGKSGAIKPHGAGYGGTNGDYAESGQYTDTWTVSLEAPLGPGKADVFVGQGDQWGYQEVAFEVVDSAVAACDAS